jgi:hypothetical protein
MPCLSLKEFYIGSEWRPAVFGMTASPVATKGNNSIHDNNVHYTLSIFSFILFQRYNFVALK